MGETTPDAVELKCPGCETYFRLTPKKGRLPTGDVSCPKCFTEIPVEDGRKIYRTRSDAGSDDAKGPERSSSAPGFGVMSRRATDDDLDGESEDAIERLTRLAGELPGGAKATMAGLPGGFPNPFSRSGDQDKTAAVDAALLSAIAEKHGNTTKSPFSEPEEPEVPAEEGLAENTSSGAWRRAHDSQTEGEPGDGSEHEVQTRKTVDLTRQRRPDPSQLRETAENKRVPRSMIGPRSGTSSEDDTTEGEVGLSDAELKTQVLARIKKKRMVTRPGESASPSPSPGASKKLSLDKLRPALSGPSAAEDDDAQSVADTEEKPSLAHLFKKAQKRRSSQAGSALSSSSQDLPAPRSERTALPRPKSEATDEAQKPSATPGIELAADEARELADLLKDVPEDGATAEGSGEASPDHSGLFDGFGAPEGAAAPGRPAMPGISRERGQTTSQSMLARLQARRRGPNVDPIELGAAGESRGSGYIRLPTAEIQDVLGQGSYRLRIEDVIYEPVDEAGLTQLIKGGVLLGAEELAEADGDWMPVSEHPVFGELRRKMAAEAHNVLSRIGTPGRKASTPPAPPQEPAFEPPLPVDSSSNSLDFSLLDVEQQGEASPEDAPTPEAPPAEQALVEAADEPSFSELDPFTEMEDPASEPEVENTRAVSAFDDTVEDRKALSQAALAAATAARTPEQPASQEPAVAVPEASSPEAAASSSFDAIPARKKSSAGLLVGLVLGVGLLAAVGAGLSAPGQAMIESTTGWNPSSLWASGPVEDNAPPEDSIATDEQQPDGESELAAEEVAEEAVEAPVEEANEPTPEERLAELREQWRAGEREPELFDTLVTLATEQEQWSLVRQASLAALAENPDDTRFSEAHRRAVEQDPAMGAYQPQVLDASSGLSLVGSYDVDTHRGWIFKLPGSDDEVIFKPSRDGWEDGWQMEVAAWRLCELIACNFEILKATPALLHADALESALEEAGDAIDADLARELSELANWQDDEEMGRVVRGSVERLPASTRAPFPIEYRPLWIDWLTATSSARPLEAPLSEELDNIASLADGKFQQPLIDAIGEQPTAEVAREVSSLLLFDYLTNNWERFSTRSETYGINNPVIDGGIVSRHNGDAFQPRASRRVQGRFEWTTRFSRSTVATIRLLERDELESILFPEAGPLDRARLNVLWSQREDLLRRVDQLVAQHGQDDVLYFP